MQDRFAYSTDDVLRMLDVLLEGRGGAWWDEFFAGRSTGCPFLVEWPDENLADWFGTGALRPGRVLELGCGNGRNAVYLASRGRRVDAVDFSAQRTGLLPARGRERLHRSAGRCACSGR